MASPAKNKAAGATPFWSVPADELLHRLDATAQGLTGAEAATRLERFGASRLRPKHEASWPGVLFGQFKSPLVLILVAASGLAFFLHDQTNAGIILGIVVVSAVLGFWQEYAAAGAVAKLLAAVQVKVKALALGGTKSLPELYAAAGARFAFDAGTLGAIITLIEEKLAAA